MKYATTIRILVINKSIRLYLEEYRGIRGKTRDTVYNISATPVHLYGADICRGTKAAKDEIQTAMM
jgi:hypothetical protein